MLKLRCVSVAVKVTNEAARDQEDLIKSRLVDLADSHGVPGYAQVKFNIEPLPDGASEYKMTARWTEAQKPIVKEWSEHGSLPLDDDAR